MRKSPRYLCGSASEERPYQPKGYEAAIQIFMGEEEHFFLPHAIPIFDQQRQLVGVTLMLTDVTRLRRLDEVKTGLISTVSHELKTPLTSDPPGHSCAAERKDRRLDPPSRWSFW